MNSPTPQHKAYTAPTFEIWAWGLGAIANHALIQIYGQAINVLTVSYALSPLLVSLCMVLPRIIDGIADPVIGHLSDNTRSRWGRRKPFLVAGALLGTLFICLIWWTDNAWSTPLQFAFLLTTGVLFYISWGAYTMAWTTMGYELSDDYSERSRIAAISGIFLAITTTAIGWIYWLALRPLFHDGLIRTVTNIATAPTWHSAWLVTCNALSVAKDAPHDEINGMRWISALLGLIIIGTAFVAARFTKERFSHANAKKAHVDIIPAIKATLKCRPFAILLSYRLFQIFMERVPTQGLFLYVAIYILCSGDKTPATKLFGLAGTGALILSFPALWSLKPLTSWVGKKTTQIGSAALSFVIALSLPLFLHAANPNWFLAPWLLCLLLATVNAAMISAMLPDICDLDELENDQRREGLFTAVLSFVVKIGISISVLIVGVFLSWAGLHAKETVQSPDFISKLFWFTVATNIVLSGLHLLFTALFPITPKMMAEVRAQLDERRLLKAEQGIPTDEVVEEYVHEHPELLKGDDSSQNKNPQNS